MTPADPPASDRYRQLYETLQLLPGEDWPALLPMLLVKVAWETDRKLDENESLFLQDHCLGLIRDVVPQVARLSPEARTLYVEELLVRGELDRHRRRVLAAGCELLAWELGKRLTWDEREHYYDSMLHRVQAMLVYLPGFHARLQTVVREFQAAVDALLPCRSLDGPPAPEPPADWRRLLWEEHWRGFLLLPFAYLAARRQRQGASLPAVRDWEYPCGVGEFPKAREADRELYQDYAVLLKKSRHALAEDLAGGSSPYELWQRQGSLMEEFSRQGFAAREEILGCFSAVLRRMRYRQPWRGDILWESWQPPFEDALVDDVVDQLHRDADGRRRRRGAAPEPARPAAPMHPAAPPPSAPPVAVPVAPALPAPPPRQEKAPPQLQPPPVIAPSALETMTLPEILKAVDGVRVEDLERDLEGIAKGLLFADAVGEGECVAVVSERPAGDLWVAGDVHADLLTLANLFRFLDAREAQGNPWSLVLLGDFIDRGSHDHETLLYLLDRLRRHPGRIALLLGNHDEDLHWDEATGRFVSTIEPAEYSERLNALLGQGAKPDDPRVRLARLAERLFGRLPRAVFLPGGLMLTHGGFPHTDRHESLRERRDLSDPAGRSAYTWNRWTNSKRKYVDAGARSNEFGWQDFAAFCKVAAERLKVPVRMLIRGHDHIQREAEVPGLGKRWVRWEWRAPEWTNAILTINAMGRRLESDHALESDAPLACLARCTAGGDVEVYPLAIDPEAVRQAYFAPPG